MILAIDTGNTNIVLGCIENRKIRAVARMATDVNKTDYEYAVGMKNVLAFAGFQPESFEGAILSNVVWPLTSTLCRAVKLLTGLDTLVVGKGLKPGWTSGSTIPARSGRTSSSARSRRCICTARRSSSSTWAPPRPSPP